MSETIREVPVRYKTTDGVEHTTKEAAERRQQLLDAEGEYEKARERYERVLAMSQFTADGEPFRFGVRDYWHLRYVYGEGLPRLERIDFGYQTKVQLGGDRLELVVHEPVPDSWNTFRSRSYRISDLYAHQRVAEAAVLVKQLEWVEHELADNPRLAEALVDSLVASAKTSAEEGRP